MTQLSDERGGRRHYAALCPGPGQGISLGKAVGPQQRAIEEKGLERGLIVQVGEVFWAITRICQHTGTVYAKQIIQNGEKLIRKGLETAINALQAQPTGQRLRRKTS